MNSSDALSSSASSADELLSGSLDWASGASALTVTCEGISMLPPLLRCLRLSGSRSSDLVLLLNLRDAEERFLHDELLGSELRFLVLNASYSAVERQRIYLEGGVLSMPLAIAAVDLLQDVLQPQLVRAVVVLRAHAVTPTSRDALVIRLLRSTPTPPTMHLFCEEPMKFSSGFSRLEKVMSCSGVSKVELWPRFRERLDTCLKKTQLDVVELFVSMDDDMIGIEGAIVDALTACVNELKSACRSVDLDDIDLSKDVAQAAFVDVRVRRSLQPHWHRLSAKAKQLVVDLGTLTNLLSYVVSFDAVSFYSFLLSVQHTQRSVRSMWLLTDAANTLFERAKSRLYTIVYSDSTTTKGKKRRSATLRRRLRPNPKWMLLRLALDEIAADPAISGAAVGGGVMVVCADDSTCSLLHEYLLEGGERLLENRWRKFVQRLQPRDASSSQDGPSDGDATIEEVGSDAYSGLNVERQLLRREYERYAKMELDEENGSGPKMVQMRLDGKKATPAPKKASRTTGRRATFSAASNLGFKHKTRSQRASTTCTIEEIMEARRQEQTATSFRVLELDGSALPVTFVASSFNETLPLRSINPRVVIVYDPNVGVLREIEMYRSFRAILPLRVYFLMYENSFEEQSYIGRIHRERDAFESLVRQKQHMVLPEPSASASSDTAAADLPLSERRRVGDPFAVSRSTRRGGASETLAPASVIVDMREFRSSLPGVLHSRGLHVRPVTLEVGDYIISDDICIERKSVADLFSSLASGRLFKQLQAMCRTYTHAVLLIEFSSDQSFSLQTYTAYESLSSSSIHTKLALVCMHFPTVRFIWSHGPVSTAKVFERLKQNRAEPDIAKAATIGSETDQDAETPEAVQASRDMLARLPAISESNARALMKRVRNLSELIALPTDELAALLSNVSAARRFKEFVGADVSSTADSVAPDRGKSVQTARAFKKRRKK